MRDSDIGSRPFDRIILIGAGVVGRAIARAHLDAEVPIELVDIDANNMGAACQALSKQGFAVSELSDFPVGGVTVSICKPPSQSAAPPAASTPSQQSILIIESIAEKRDWKRQLYGQISEHFGASATIATNTSSLRLADLASACLFPDRFCGMHFFMPVESRKLIEVVAASTTSLETRRRLETHSIRISKIPLLVADSPGFVVNRILTPYLNQAIRLLGQGAQHLQIAEAAEAIGMPMSPLRLIDWIGARTAFDAGRAAWQAFSHRIDPAPILPGMVKRGLLGRAVGVGFYNYPTNDVPNELSDSLSTAASEVVARYQSNVRNWTTDEIQRMLGVPLWIEAACVLREHLVADETQVELAMTHGLGFNRPSGFFELFENWGNDTLLQTSRDFGGNEKAVALPAELATALESCSTVRSAIHAFAECRE